MTALTLWFFLDAPQYRVVEENLLADTAFAGGARDFDADAEQRPEKWIVTGPSESVRIEDGTLTVANADPAKQVTVFQIVDVPAELGFIELHGEAAASDVVAGPKGWNVARIYLVARNDRGQEMWGYMATPVSIVGDRDWRRFSASFRMPEGMSEVSVAVQMAWATGQIQVRGLELHPLEKRWFADAAAILLPMAWAAVLLWLAVPVYRGIPSPAFKVLLIGCLAFGAATIMMPEDLKTSFMASLMPWLPGADLLRGENGRISMPLMESVGHFFMFTLFAIVARVVRPQDHFLIQFGCLVLFAAATEAVQFFAVNRTPGMEDWLVDTAGLVLGYALFYLARLGWTLPTRLRA